MTHKRFEKDILEILQASEENGVIMNDMYNCVIADLLELFFKHQEEIREYAKNIMLLKSKSNVENATWFKKGQNSIRRKNKSGCCCMFSDDDTEITSLCGAHEDYYEEKIKNESI